MHPRPWYSSGVWMRPAALADAPAVLAVLLARDRADLGAPDHRLQGLLDLWGGGELDLMLDTIVAEDPFGIAGYAAVSRQGSMAAVTPDREGRGIGARLLDWTEHRERGREQTEFRLGSRLCPRVAGAVPRRASDRRRA